jgi:hypothetical protein
VKHRGKILFFAGLFFTMAMGWFAFPRVLYQKTNQPLQFSHRVHTGEQAGLTCDSCHVIRADGRFTGIPGIAKCAECHATPIGSTPEEKELIEKYVTPNREIPWLVYSRQPENVYFSHVQHVKTGRLQCERCHGPHGSTERLRPYQQDRLSGYSRDIWGQNIVRNSREPWDGMEMNDCAKCHQQHGKVDSCLDCHK